MHSENIAKHEPPMISVALYALKTKKKNANERITWPNTIYVAE